MFIFKVIIVVVTHIQIPFVGETVLFEASYSSVYHIHLHHVKNKYEYISFIITGN